MAVFAVRTVSDEWVRCVWLALSEATVAVCPAPKEWRHDTRQQTPQKAPSCAASAPNDWWGEAFPPSVRPSVFATEVGLVGLVLQQFCEGRHNQDERERERPTDPPTHTRTAHSSRTRSCVYHIPYCWVAVCVWPGAWVVLASVCLSLSCRARDVMEDRETHPSIQHVLAVDTS